jgi:hypothetical protein
MGLSTYLKAYKYMSDVFENDGYKIVAEALSDVAPLDIGIRHNATPNIQIEIPIATWHKGYAVDEFLWEKGGKRDADEYELESWTTDVQNLILQAREYATRPELANNLGVENEPQEWVAEQFLRLERALTDFALDDRLKGWALKVWRSY